MSGAVLQNKTFLEGFVHVDLPEDLEDSAAGFNEILDETPKKTRKSYTYQVT